MPLSIRNEEVNQLARKLAARKHINKTDAVKLALENELITIGFSYFFGGDIFRAQVVMCLFFSILLGMTILAILELAHPYQGVVTISDEPFRHAPGRMRGLAGYKMASITP